MTYYYVCAYHIDEMKCCVLDIFSDNINNRLCHSQNPIYIEAHNIVLKGYNRVSKDSFERLYGRIHYP